ncbi:MAG: gliding motility-associated ABC transporter ATP-binding subunit GldA [Bacteroidetes bacterium 4484_249]|nr:MAG: gliding motility-associated ABC transporter ATP-binding subunit GldA [Bacteroidetes bacterium 4484_249]
MSIEVKNITKVFGKQKALDDMSFNINPGEVVGLLGPNGAGKSTMMKIITCFIPPTSGSVSVYGFDIFEHSIEVRKKVGYLPENNPLYTDMYVKEYLEFIAGIYKLKNKKSRVDEMVGLTGLEIEQKKKIGALSKGYRQRVGLAQALIHNPDVLILDEPTSGLDPNQLLEIRNLIKEIGKEKTVMLSTHIMQEVEAVCDRVIIIDKGIIVADDSTANLSLKTSGVQIIKVEFNKKINRELLLSVKGVNNCKNINTNHWEIEADISNDIRENIFQFAVDNGFAVLALQKTEQGLEDVFRQLTSD